MSDSLQELSRQLSYAAGEGAQRLAQDVLASAHATAELGHRLRLPGPGLQQALGDSGDPVDSQVPAADVANVMAEQLANGGAKLVGS